MSNLVAVNLGSNYAARVHLNAAINALSQFAPICLSSVYTSPAHGILAEDFYNLSVCFYSEWSVEKLHHHFKHIEKTLGRDQFTTKAHIQPIDIDFLLYNHNCCHFPALPHGDIVQYAHVLRPLSEILPDYVHPETGDTLITHWQKMAADNPKIKKVAFHINATFI